MGREFDEDNSGAQGWIGVKESSRRRRDIGLKG